MAHVLLITTSYPQHQDGSEAAGAFVADFATTLSQQVNVTVLAPALSASKQVLSNSLCIQYFSVPRLPLSLLKPYNPAHWTTIISTLRAGSTAVREITRQEKFDHILALWVLPSGYWAQQAKDVPYSTWALGSDIWSLGRVPLIKQLLQKVLRESQHNYSDGYDLAEQVRKLSFRSCQFLPSTREIGLPKPKILATLPPYKLSFIGRWHRNKGIDILLKTLANLGDKDWALIAEIRIAGGGPLEKLVRKEVSELQSHGRPIYLKGYLDKQGAAELLWWTDYLLIPSRIESVPVVFSDAMKCLCPVVSMPTGDLPRLLQSYNVGSLAADISSAEFASALTRLLRESPSKYETALNHAAADFDLKHSVETFLSYTTIVSK